MAERAGARESELSLVEADGVRFGSLTDPRTRNAQHATNHAMARILIVSSVGGHLDEVMQLAPLLERHEVSLVVNERCELPVFDFGRVYRICHAERDWRVVKNLTEAARILLSELPDVILSTGAGPAVPFAVAARLLGNIRVVFTEIASAVVRPSLFGRIMYFLSHDFFYQWPALARFFPKGKLVELTFR